MKEKIINIIYKDNKIVNNRLSEKYFKNNYYSLYEFIISKVKWTKNFSVKIYCIINNITTIPTCKSCNNVIDYNNKRFSFKNGFNKYCSLKCLHNSEEVKDKRKKTMIKNYGVEHPLQSEEIKEKIIKKNNKKYNSNWYVTTEEFKNKNKNTVKSKYGVNNISQNENIKEKIKKTNLKRYGAISSFSNKRVRKKHEENLIKKYGVDHVSKINGVKQKREKTNEKKYGYKYSSKNIDVKNKQKETIKNNYLKKHSKNFNIEFSENNELIIRNYCDIHKTFIIDQKNFYNRVYRYKIKNICTKCNPIGKIFTSSIEQEIIDFIENECSYKTKKLKFNKNECDIFIPQLNIGFEVNGIYWHSEKFKDLNYHYNKFNFFKENGINIINIWEDQWLNKKRIVKSHIRSKLKKTPVRIFARKCDIKIINNDLCNVFIKNNSLVDNIESTVNIGLYYNNELVSAMCFYNKNNLSYVLDQFVSKIDTQVIGGGSRLLKYFLNKYDCEEIVANHRNDYGVTDFFDKIRLKKEKTTQPNIMYVNKHGLIRYFDKTKINNSYYTVYDTGNTVFIYKKHG